MSARTSRSPGHTPLPGVLAVSGGHLRALQRIRPSCTASVRGQSGRGAGEARTIAIRAGAWHS
eukprot:4306143-Prorocentrum_lima.AAC.1